MNCITTHAPHFRVTQRRPDTISVVAYIADGDRLGAPEFSADPIGHIFSQSGMHELLRLLSSETAGGNDWSILETQCACCGLVLANDAETSKSRELYFYTTGENLGLQYKDREARACGACATAPDFDQRILDAIDRICQRQSGLSFLPSDW